MTWIESMYLLVQVPPDQGHVKRLHACASACTQASQSTATALQSRSFWQWLLDLAELLQALEEEWGIWLRAGPEHIWGDITAFFPNSRFLQETTATKINSLPRDIPVHSLQSQRPLSIISESDTAVGRMVKLSVWPSRYVRNSSLTDIKFRN